MRNSLILCFGLMFTCSFSQTIALHGKVIDKNGSPVTNAVVSLTGQNMLDTTGSDGKFSFESSTTDIKNGINVNLNQLLWEKGMLSLTLSKASNVHIDAYDVHGRSFFSRKIPNLAAGSHNFAVGSTGVSGVYFVRADIDGKSHTFMISSVGSEQGKSIFKDAHSSAARVLKKDGSSTSYLVSLYGDINYGNLEAQLDTGTYTTAQLKALGVTDNDISSMLVPAGLTVKLYDADNFQTLLGTYTSDQSNFITLGVNDKLSSIAISGTAYIDTLTFEATGFISKTLPITSYEDSMTVSLDSLNPASADTGRSVGCGKALGSLKTGYYTIVSGGTTRNYAIDIPTNYDPDKPYRLIYCSHWIYANDSALVNGSVTNGGAANWAFYGLKRVLDSAGVAAIFIAPTALNGMWGQVDHALFDTLLSYAKTNLCVDTARVFAAGFSFGAMQTYSLSTSHQKQLRAVATLAAANYNIWLPTNTHEKIPYLGITGMSDGTCPFIYDANSSKGGFYAATSHATDNGCTVPSSITKTYAGSKTHVVYDFENCDSGYPVRYITFDGAHIAAPTDGQTTDDGRKTWAPHEMWKFFSQF
ncbi:MAG: hypothetical protein WCR04_02705 [Fibrobacteraceae bacterium]